MHMYNRFVPGGTNLLWDVLGMNRSQKHDTSLQTPVTQTTQFSSWSSMKSGKYMLTELEWG